MKKIVAFSFLGTTLDHTGAGSQRWERWRPSIGLCQQQDLVIDRLELLHDARHHALAKRIQRDIETISPETHVQCTEINLRDPWDFEEVYAMLYELAQGYPFDLDNEAYLLHLTTGTHVAQICWFLLAEARYFPARLVQTSPPKNSRDKAGSYTIIDLDLSRYNLISSRFQQESEHTQSFLKSGIMTRNAHFNHVITQIERIATHSTAPILLSGPAGAGKSLLAQRIYALKRNRHQVTGRFIEINCATLQGDHAIVALFGSSKGLNNTSAKRDGALMHAEGGLLLLNEIDVLNHTAQAMLFEALEKKSFSPVGSDQIIPSDFQLISNTRYDLQQQVANGQFREDLYAKISLWHWALPSLSHRREDIEPNVDFELVRFSETDGAQVRFNVEARRQYLNFATSPEAIWKGNFRTLSASITRLATLAEAGKITESLVAQEIDRLKKDGRHDTPFPQVTRYLGTKVPQLDLFDLLQLENVMTICKQSSSLSEAGRHLFAISRQERTTPNDADRLRKYLARYGLEWDSFK